MKGYCKTTLSARKIQKILRFDVASAEKIPPYQSGRHFEYSVADMKCVQSVALKSISRGEKFLGKFLRRPSTFPQKCPCDIRGSYFPNLKSAINKQGGDSNAERMTLPTVGKQWRKEN